MRATAYLCRRLYPVSSPPLDNAILIVRDGSIVYAGSRDGADTQDAHIIDLGDAFILPGFVDAHTHVGMWGEWYGGPEHDGNEATNPVTPEVRAIDSIWPAHTAFEDARSGGVTTVQITPGSGNIIGGQPAVLKTRGTKVEDMAILWPSGMKVALGENPKGLYGRSNRMPATRMGNAAVLRAALCKAQDYERKVAAAADDPKKMPDTDLGLGCLVKVLHKEIPLRVHAHRADDIVTAVRIAEEFDLDYSIEHCTDGATIAEFLGSRRAKVNVGPSMWQRGKMEVLNISLETAGILAKAGCRVSIISDHPFHPIQHLSTAAAMSAANGLDPDEAIRAITLTPAETLGVSHRVGSLEAGKDADFVVWTGSPLMIRSSIKDVYIDGQKVWSEE